MGLENPLAGATGVLVLLSPFIMLFWVLCRYCCADDDDEDYFDNETPGEGEMQSNHLDLARVYEIQSS